MATNIIRTFDSMVELLRAVAEPFPPELDERYRASLHGTEKFTGTKSLDEAIDLARKGWDGGVAAIESMKVEIEKLSRGLVPLPENVAHVTRGNLKVDRYLRGLPKTFVRKVDTARTKDARIPKIIPMVINVAVSGSISKDVILRRGAAMIVACQTLEKRGIRCSIDLAFTISDSIMRPNPNTLEYRLRVKQPNEHVSLNRLAFLTAHPASLRRLMFALEEHEDEPTRRMFGIASRGYGLPAETQDQGRVYLGRVLSNTDWSEAVVMAWLRKTLTENGLTLRDTPQQAQGV